MQFHDFHDPPSDKTLIFIQPRRTAGNASHAILQEEFGPQNIFKLGYLDDFLFTYEDFLKDAQAGAHTIYMVRLKYIPKINSWYEYRADNV